MDAVQIGAGDESLRLSPDGDQTVSPEYLLAELRSGHLGNLIAVKRIYSAGYAADFQGLAGFFANLAAGWRGWDGERSWESIEGDLRLDARHSHGHVQLRVTLRADGPGWGNGGWTATADLTLDPGEQLSVIAADVAGLMTRST